MEHGGATLLPAVKEWSASLLLQQLALRQIHGAVYTDGSAPHPEDS